MAGSLPDGFADRRPLYRAVVFRIQSMTFEIWAPDAPESTDELADWVERELSERLDAVT